MQPNLPRETQNRSDQSNSGLRRGLAAAGVLAALIAVGAIVSTSLASAGGWWGSRSFGHGHHGQHDPERMKNHAEFAVGWALNHVDATDAQESEVQEIVAGLIDGVSHLGEEHRAHREALVAELASDQVDAEAIEAIRRSEIELADTASLELFAAMTEIARVLTPEQRQQLIELAEDHH